MPQQQKKNPNTRVVHRMYIFPAFPPIMWLVWVIRSVQRLTWSHSWLLLSSSPWKKYCRVTSAFLWGVKWRPGSVLPWSSLDVSAALFPVSVCVCVYSGFGDPYKAKRIDNRVARGGTCWPNKHWGLTLRKARQSACELSVDRHPRL